MDAETGPGDLAGRTMAVTGANSGIGLATVSALAGRGARVVLCARDAGRGRRALDSVRAAHPGAEVELVCFDLSSLDSVRRGAEELLARVDRLDVLVNNAGLVLGHRRETPEGFEATFAINHLGPFLLTTLLCPRLVASAPARVVTVSSVSHRQAVRGLDFDDLGTRHRYRGMKAYGRSKLAGVLVTAELARRLAGTGVTANSCHPGVVRTRYGRDGDTRGLLPLGMTLIAPLLKSAEEGARLPVHLATAPELEQVTGAYFSGGRAVRPSRAARDRAAAARLFAVSTALTGAPPVPPT